MQEPVMPNSLGASDAGRPNLGLTLVPLTDNARARVGMETQQLGVLVEDVVTDSIAWDRGISPGSVILRVDEQPVSAPADVEGHIDDARRRGRDLVLLLIEDPQGRHWTAVPLKSAS